MPVNPNDLKIGDKVLVTEQSTKFSMLKGTVGKVDKFTQLEARVTTKFPSGAWFAQWVDLKHIVKLPEEAGNERV